VFKPGQAPEEELELDYIHGCHFEASCSNLLVTRLLHVVYSLANIAIVHDSSSSSQRFCWGHTDRVLSMALHPDQRLFATGQAGPDPLVFIWDSEEEEVKQVESSRVKSVRHVWQHVSNRVVDVSSLCFASNGRYLVVLGGETQVAVWDWRVSSLVACASGDPNPTFCSLANPKFQNHHHHHQQEQHQHQHQHQHQGEVMFVSCGYRHILFWTMLGGRLRKSYGDLCSRGLITNHYSLEFVRDLLVSGTEEGYLYIWKDSKLLSIHHAHSGPVLSLSSSSQGAGGPVVVSGGADRVVKTWRIFEDTEELEATNGQGIAMETVTRGMTTAAHPESLAVHALQLRLVPHVTTNMSQEVWRVAVGTRQSGIFLLTLPSLISNLKEEVLEFYQDSLSLKVYKSVTYDLSDSFLPAVQFLNGGLSSSDPSSFETSLTARAIAANPCSESQYAVGDAAGRVRVWDSSANTCVSILESRESEGRVFSLAYMPQPEDARDTWRVVVGLKGGVQMFDQSSDGDDVEMLREGIGSKDVVSALKFSQLWEREDVLMCYLAVGTSRGSILLFEWSFETERFTKRSKLRGHSGILLNIDFSSADMSEPSYMRSNCTRFELRHWDLRSFLEVRSAAPLREEVWSSSSCSLSWSATGIHPELYEVVPAVDASPDNKLLVASGPGGEIQLYRFPCLQHSKCSSVKCSNEIASCIRFAAHGQFALASFRNSRTIARFRKVVPVPAELECFLMQQHESKGSSVLLGDPGDVEEVGAELPEDRNVTGLTSKSFNSSGFDDFDPSELQKAARITELKRKGIRPLHVLGVKGRRKGNSAHVTSAGEVFYSSANVGVIQRSKKQLLLNGHEGQVEAAAVSADRKLLATSDDSRTGKVLVWEAASAMVKAELKAEHDGGCSLLAFCPQSKYLVGIGTDLDRSIFIWDLQSKSLAAASPGPPTSILSMTWLADGDVPFLITAGDKHVSCWAVQDNSLSREERVHSVLNRTILQPSTMRQRLSLVPSRSLWKEVTRQMVFSVCLLEPTGQDKFNNWITGLQDGGVCRWERRRGREHGDSCVRRYFRNLHDGPVTQLVKLKQHLASCSWDGKVKLYEPSSFLKDYSVVKEINVNGIMQGVKGYRLGTYVKLIGMDVVVNAELKVIRFLLKTHANEVLDLSADQSSFEVQSKVTVTEGHSSSSILALSTHSCFDVFATGGDDGVIKLWDIGTRQCFCATSVRMVEEGLDGAITSLCWRGSLAGKRQADFSISNIQGDEVAVGMRTGSLLIARFDSELVQLTRVAHVKFDSAISAVKFDPSGTYVAVGLQDGSIRLVLSDGKYPVVGQCDGHTCAAASIDWSEDGEYLATSSQTGELFFWDMRLRSSRPTGGVQQFRHVDIPIKLYSKRWASFTSLLGWPMAGLSHLAGRVTSVDRYVIDRDKALALVAVSDKSGRVSVYPYPYPEDILSSANSYEVLEALHSSPVTAVRFTNSGRYLVSVGGDDLSIMIWQVMDIGEDEDSSKQPQFKSSSHPEDEEDDL